MSVLTPTTCPSHPAGPDDRVDGVPASVVATPTSAVEVGALLAHCRAEGLAVVARGSGTKLTWGRPPERLDVIVDTTGLSGVIDHAVGDLVVTVGAGTTLGELAGVIGPTGQQLVVDDPFDGRSTVGGAIATNLSGPRRLMAGSLRDLLIGVTIALPDGTLARAGGKVVKNVAGYDLGKLFTGSFGTLGVIVEATFRLHPIPAASSWLAGSVSRADLPEVLAGVIASQVVPTSVEIDHDGPAHAPTTVAVLLTGTVAGVPARAARLTAEVPLLAASEQPMWIGRFPWRNRDNVVAVKVTSALSGIAELVAAGGSRGFATRGSAGTGVLYAVLPAPDAGARVAGLRATADMLGGSLVVLDAPEPTKAVLDTWGPVRGIELMRAIKAEFDPDRVMAPGRFVGGI